MMTDSVKTEPNLRAGRPRILFGGLSLLSRVGNQKRDYDATPDGKRFLVVKRGKEYLPTQINVVLNWAEELKQKVPDEN